MWYGIFGRHSLVLSGLRKFDVIKPRLWFLKGNIKMLHTGNDDLNVISAPAADLDMKYEGTAIYYKLDIDPGWII